MVKLTKDISENFPFISVVLYGGIEYIGIIVNQDQNVTTMYNYENLRSNEEKQQFLDLGEVWWWESNRSIPINLFLKVEMLPFRYSIINMNSKDVAVQFGPTVNLNEMAIKRVKRKTVQLLRKNR